MQGQQETPALAGFGRRQDTGDRSEAEPLPNFTAPAQGTEERYPVMLDCAGFSSKPTGMQLGAITNRLKRAGASQVTMPELWAHIKSGRTFMCGTFEPHGGAGWGSFLGQRLFGVDVDNHFGNFDLKPWEQGFLGHRDAVNRCRALGIQPMLLYFTMSADLDAGRVRYRLLFDARRTVTDIEEARSLQALLLGKFPEADQACNNPHTRLWLGAGRCGGWELWRIPREFWKEERQ